MAIQILSDLGVGKMRILGSPRKLNALKGFGLEVVEYNTEDQTRRHAIQIQKGI
jgi:3,4-dihydroxy 2-butanone 4-phosphate synthase/GTP cyclohydrolase II